MDLNFLQHSTRDKMITRKTSADFHLTMSERRWAVIRNFDRVVQIFFKHKLD